MIKSKFGITLSDDKDEWTGRSAFSIYYALVILNKALGGGDILRTLIGSSTFYRGASELGEYSGWTKLNGSSITFFFNSDQTAPNQNVFHEVGHLIDFKAGGYFSNMLNSSAVYDANGDFVMGTLDGKYNRKDARYDKSFTKSRVTNTTYSTWSTVSAQQHPGTISSTDAWGIEGNTADEEWADLIANYAVNNFANNAGGIARVQWIESALSSYSENVIEPNRPGAGPR